MIIDVMARGMHIEIELQGAEEVADHLHDVGRRLVMAAHGFERVMPILEEGERAHFGRLKGRYVDSGALRDSLTDGLASHGIRVTHPDGLDFGTDLFYAHFLTKRKKDPEDGQVRARRRAGKSAVLSLTPKTRKEAARTLLEWATTPWGDGPESRDDPLAVHRF